MRDESGVVRGESTAGKQMAYEDYLKEEENAPAIKKAVKKAQKDLKTANRLPSPIKEQRLARINKAIDYWQSVLPKLEKGSDEEKNIKKYIEFAAKENNISLDNSAVEKTNLSEYSIKLNIELSSEFSAVDINNTVFIYAKPVNSNIKMPIVVLRKKVSALPLELSLDDSMSMLPNIKLSGYESVIVLARISKTGNAKSEKGDLIGVSNPISTRSKETIKIIINSIVE